MKGSKWCDVGSCCWEMRFEILGLVLIVIATLLTIASHNSFGIVTMFIVGAVLVCYRNGLNQFSCHKQDKDEVPKAQKSKK